MGGHRVLPKRCVCNVNLPRRLQALSNTSNVTVTQSPRQPVTKLYKRGTQQFANWALKLQRDWGRSALRVNGWTATSAKSVIANHEGHTMCCGALCAVTLLGPGGGRGCAVMNSHGAHAIEEQVTQTVCVCSLILKRFLVHFRKCTAWILCVGLFC